MEHCRHYFVAHHSLYIFLVVVEQNTRGKLLLREHSHLQAHQMVRFSDVPSQRGLVTVCARYLTDRFDHLLHQEERLVVVFLVVEARVHVERGEARSPTSQNTKKVDNMI